MASQKEQKALLDHLASLRPDYDKVLKVLESTPEVPNLYHISSNPNIKHFIPMVTRRSIQDEDRSVPRVCVSENLWDCFAGYSAAVEEFHEHPDGFLGGYVVYALPFKLAVVPNKTVLPDVRETNERWIVGYDPEHLKIAPEIHGKVFIREVKNTRQGKVLNRTITLYLEVFDGFGPFRVHESLELKAGYYRLTCDNVVDRKGWSLEHNDVQVEIIDKAEYTAVKKSVASLLSFESVPASKHW